MDPLAGQRVSKWPGRISDADPTDLPPGGMVAQDNWESLIPGRLTVRKGLRRVTFTNDAAPSTVSSADIISLHRHHHGVEDVFPYQLDDGSVCVGTGPLTVV